MPKLSTATYFTIATKTISNAMPSFIGETDITVLSKLSSVARKQLIKAP